MIVSNPRRYMYIPSFVEIDPLVPGKKILRVFTCTIYGRGGYLGHVTQMPRTSFCPLYPWRLHTKDVCTLWTDVRQTDAGPWYTISLKKNVNRFKTRKLQDALEYGMSRVMRKPAFYICENKDADQLRSNCEVDQRLCFRYMDSAIKIRNFKPLAIFCDCTARFAWDLVENPEYRFSHNEAHMANGPP